MNRKNDLDVFGACGRGVWGNWGNLGMGGSVC